LLEIPGRDVIGGTDPEEMAAGLARRNMIRPFPDHEGDLPLEVDTRRDGGIDHLAFVDPEGGRSLEKEERLYRKGLAHLESVATVV
jgi:hypothetical protein